MDAINMSCYDVMYRAQSECTALIHTNELA